MLISLGNRVDSDALKWRKRKLEENLGEKDIWYWVSDICSFTKQSKTKNYMFFASDKFIWSFGRLVQYC